jgi:hypothetical protein
MWDKTLSNNFSVICRIPHPHACGVPYITPPIFISKKLLPKLKKSTQNVSWMFYICKTGEMK